MVVAQVAQVLRPLRRRLFASRYKEAYLDAVARRRADSHYVEIGVRTGDSFRRVGAAHKVAIDPVRHPEVVLDSHELFFEMPSDEFFADHANGVLAPGSVDLALVDGLHHFDQALRDFENLEPYMRPDGVIFLDDCNPPTRERAEVRDGGAWNGDVWRVCALLAATRPDLQYVTFDCDQGLARRPGSASARPWLRPSSGRTSAAWTTRTSKGTGRSST